MNLKLIICIDDTDNLESKGTGSIADEMREIICNEGFGKCGIVTRHQLLLHSDIPYTSHNSSMCFDCEIDDSQYDTLEERLSTYLKNESADGSDPGICILKLTDSTNESILLKFGLRAKKSVLTKMEAYNIANELGIYLKEEGGTGQGVIGALAGVGLRLGGNDGEVKGEIKQYKKGETYTVSHLLSGNVIQKVCDLDYNILNGHERVYITWKAKPILVSKEIVLLVKWSEEKKQWVTMEKKEMRAFGDERIYKQGCEAYAPDVPEEHVNDHEHSCLNCRYRRWTEDTFLCTYTPKGVCS